MASDRGGRFGFIYKNRQRVYAALRREGKPASVAAAIANGGHTSGQRKAQARKAARTRKAKGKR